MDAPLIAIPDGACRRRIDACQYHRVRRGITRHPRGGLVPRRRSGRPGLLRRRAAPGAGPGAPTHRVTGPRRAPAPVSRCRRAPMHSARPGDTRALASSAGWPPRCRRQPISRSRARRGGADTRCSRPPPRSAWAARCPIHRPVASGAGAGRWDRRRTAAVGLEPRASWTPSQGHHQSRIARSPLAGQKPAPQP
jgi:hypothetical protein